MRGDKVYMHVAGLFYEESFIWKRWWGDHPHKAIRAGKLL